MRSARLTHYILLGLAAGAVLGYVVHARYPG